MRSINELMKFLVIRDKPKQLPPGKYPATIELDESGYFARLEDGRRIQIMRPKPRKGA